jgi:hybrid cluster-associated redox disulfide protein
MNTEPLTEDTTIEELLERLPGSIRVFQEFQLPCFVCGEPTWGTIGELARRHGVNLQELLRRLNDLQAGLQP